MNPIQVPNIPSDSNLVCHLKNPQSLDDMVPGIFIAFAAFLCYHNLQMTAKNGGFADGMNLTVSKATVSSGVFAFKNVCALIRVDLQEDGVTRIAFRGNKNESLAGTVDISINPSGIPEAEVVVDAQKSITIGDGVNVLSRGAYYLCAIPTSLPDGFTLSFSYKDGPDMVAKGTNPADLERNVILNLGAKRWICVAYAPLQKALPWSTGSDKEMPMCQNLRTRPVILLI